MDPDSDFGGAVNEASCHVQESFLEAIKNALPAWRMLNFSSEHQVGPTLREFSKRTQEFFEREVEAMKETSEKALRLRGEALDLQKTLKWEPVDIAPGNESIQDYVKKLHALVESLSLEKKRREDVFAVERDVERKFCLQLDTTASYFQDGVVPTLEDIAAIRDRVEQLRVEKRSREVKLHEFRRQIFKLILDLGRSELEFEILTRSGTNDSLHPCFMAAYEELRNELEEERRQKKEERTKLEAEIRLWSSRLGVEDDFRVDFPSNAVSEEVLAAVRALHERMLVERRINIPRLVEGVRDEIRALQAELLYSAEEKAAFAPVLELESSTADDECLSTHDQECARLREELNGKADILHMLASRAELIQKLGEIRKRELDPKRFQNRKGQLLKDSDDKKASCKELPVLESKISVAIERWQETAQKKFTIDGVKFEDVVAKDAAERERELKHPKSCSCFVPPKKDERTPFTADKSIRNHPGTMKPEPASAFKRPLPSSAPDGPSRKKTRETGRH